MDQKGKKKVFSLRGFDFAHYKTTEAYARAIEALMKAAAEDVARSAHSINHNPDKGFSFDDYPRVKAQMQKIVSDLAKGMTAVINSGIKKEWLWACKKNDGFIASILDTSKISKSRLEKMQDRNLEALKAFQGRKVAGMNLSERIWKYTQQFRDQIEASLDVGIGEGKSARELAKELTQNLQDPNLLFRRVRNKRGNLSLSKAAKAFHPGQGINRSSFKNAMRVARTEINMAYRESDHLRWQNLDFVLGFEVKRGMREKKYNCNLCDRLAGRYPKTFKFTGWHPQCLCYADPILDDFYSKERSDDRIARFKAALNGTEYKKYTSKDLITDFPDNFKEWVSENAPKQAGWASTPYFIKDNFKDGKLSEGLIYAPPKYVDEYQPGQEHVRNEIKSITAPEWRFKQDAPGETYRKRLSTLVENIVRYEGSENVQLNRFIKGSLELIESRAHEEILRHEFRNWRNYQHQMETDSRPCYESINRLNELRQISGQDIFSGWKDLYNKQIDAINKHDFARKGYRGMYTKIEAAYNIYKLSTMNEAREYGLHNISPKMPYNLLTDLRKNLSTYKLGKDTSIPSKEFWDSFNEFVPLVDIGVNGSHFSPFHGYVHIDQGMKGITRLSLSPWQRKAILHHEYGHAYDHQMKLSEDKEVLELYSRFRSAVLRDDAKAIESRINAILEPYEQEKQKLKAEWNQTLEAKRISSWEFKQLKFLQSDMYTSWSKRTKYDEICEQIGKLSDCLQAATRDHRSIKPRGHRPEYFASEEAQIKEFIAHMFENKWSENEWFRQLAPGLYKRMQELLTKKMK